MGLSKGQTNNPNGRPKGTPNKVTKDIREAYKEFVENNVDKFQSWIDKVAETNPAKALELTASLSEYFLPKLSRTEADITTKGESLNKPIIEFTKENKNK